MLRNQSNNATFMQCTTRRRHLKYIQRAAASIQMEAWKLHLVSARKGQDRKSRSVQIRTRVVAPLLPEQVKMFQGGDHKNQSRRHFYAEVDNLRVRSV